jgi:hypothetical protein
MRYYINGKRTTKEKFENAVLIKDQFDWELTKTPDSIKLDLNKK